MGIKWGNIALAVSGVGLLALIGWLLSVADSSRDETEKQPSPRPTSSTSSSSKQQQSPQDIISRATKKIEDISKDLALLTNNFTLTGSTGNGKCKEFEESLMQLQLLIDGLTDESLREQKKKISKDIQRLISTLDDLEERLRCGT